MDFVILKLNYDLQGTRTIKRQLKSANSLIRASVKGALHLNIHTWTQLYLRGSATGVWFY